ncbi:MAG: Rne/Rng family ribonuclease, partial [Gaiellales bacterium]
MKKILISADAYETKAALIEDDRVVETYIEREERRSLLGNIYLAKVDTVLPGMEAAFVDAGMDKNAFLHVAEIRIEGLDQRARRSKRIQDLVKSGQSLLVQVTKDPMKTKGARVTMDVSLAGRFLVYVPDGEGGGVSKRLPDGERDRLRDLVKQLKPRLGGGLIVRTAAKGAELAELERDLALLEDQWEGIRARVETAVAPSLIHAEVDIALGLVRDDFRQDVDELIVDDEAMHDRIVSYVQERSPELAVRVHRHTAQTELLRRYGVDEAIESTLKRRVDLPSGGYLLFDYAEAFTIVDVNTGRFVGKGRLEDTIVHNNLEAAREVVRQLRLRDLGGIIVIDFVDMESKTNRDQVIAALKEELAKDRSKVYLVSISPLGLVEMTRQNVTDGVREIMTTECPCCAGEGRVLSDETIALDNLRTLRRQATLSDSEAFLVEVNATVAARMIGPGGSRLEELERDTGKHFSIVALDDVPRERCEFVKHGKVSEVLEDANPLEIGQELQFAMTEPHMYQAADAVTVLEGGYRVVIAGAGPYLGETHRIKIERVGRLEAHAVLLDASPITEAEMIKMVDPRSDVHEPPRLVGERIDLEGRKRKGKRSRTPSATIDTPTGDVTAAVGEETEPLEKPIEPEVVADDVLLDEDGLPVELPAAKPKRRRKPAATDADAGDEDVDVDEDEDEDEQEGEATADGAPRKRRRRGRRGGARRRAAGEGADTGSADEAGGNDVADEPVEASGAVAASEDGAPKPKRRRSRGGRGRSRSGAGARPGGGEGGGGSDAGAKAPRPPKPAAEAASAPKEPTPKAT